MMDWSPRCYIPSIVEIGLPVPEKIFIRVFTIDGRGGHLGHVTSIMSSDFHFLVLKSFHKKLVQIGTVVSEKIRFEFLYVHDLKHKTYKTWKIYGKEMTLTFNTHIPS